MSGHSSRLSADLRWVEAMLTDLQRQIDELAGELRALSHLVHVHTLATLRADTHSTDTPATPTEADDAR
ncbi:hypothetical protein GCM10029963_33610 [Micromonospora andamanensis]|uniref:hypothetical protein n=1 Tax=Micromonospora andamanensis TaxID=1287068 RepID=UPI0019515906|nr:hypothetical protein [Micromonospora andamanensis]GIJ42400.1 hypothetical protein Vwe01_57250 [Micromonospora andamanensis]